MLGGGRAIVAKHGLIDLVRNAGQQRRQIGVADIKEGAQVQILAAIARFMSQPNMQGRMMALEDPGEVHRVLVHGLREHGVPTQSPH